MFPSKAVHGRGSFHLSASVPSSRSLGYFAIISTLQTRKLRVEVTSVQTLQLLHLQTQSMPKVAHATACVAAVTYNVAQPELTTLYETLAPKLGEITHVMCALSSVRFGNIWPVA